jgi:hypothetical protein
MSSGEMGEIAYGEAMDGLWRELGGRRCDKEPRNLPGASAEDRDRNQTNRLQAFVFLLGDISFLTSVTILPRNESIFFLRSFPLRLGKN